MESGTLEWTLVMNRLERLEKQNRRFRQIGAVALVLLGSVFLMGQADPPRTVEATHFVLKDDNGKSRAEWIASPSVTALIFDDNAGYASLVLQVDNGNPSLVLYKDKKVLWKAP